MKRFLLLLTFALASFSMLTVTAEAKRMGGGGSIGQQRTMSPQQASKAPAAAPAPAAPAAGNKWLGPLAGLAIGAGLGAMFAGGLGGLGGAMGGILMALLAAGLVMFLVSRFRKSRGQQPAMQYAGSGTSSYQPESRQQPFVGGSAANPAPQVNSSSNIPADFPAEAFLRSAKTSFIRLQAANDRKDLNDIREYTTPEMFAEISLQLQERGDAPQKTDVQTINTQIVEVVNEGDYAIASVRMSGQLSENNGVPENFDEIWHVQKNLRDEKAVWLLSGIQQVA
ncbi:Tim44 domain-containing protein [Candidatus Nitrotoga arctica]|uniref:Lipid-binding transport protein, Tim44 family n=1 Tax=Candidatus Nitrotoga arctica TaxID=453162 RepID=A0ABM8YWY5_9PROT|nr:TIM44-like domain-containing protein [Candidatus Nitrotoga arctica]CAG9931952.1 putative lipid-binding transport protein, Tim44 family [Candidatus Nitrotoga arctica]